MSKGKSKRASFIKFTWRYKRQMPASFFTSLCVSTVFWNVISIMIAEVKGSPDPNMTVVERQQYLADMGNTLTFLYNFRIIGFAIIALLMFLPVLYLRIKIHDKADLFVEWHDYKEKTETEQTE